MVLIIRFGSSPPTPTPNPSRMREGDALGRNILPHLVGVGTQATMPVFKTRNTARARSLRNQATPAERKLWEYLSRSQLGAKFSRQMPVGPWYADFLCRELSLVIELDGFSHDVQPEKDVRRDADLTARGYIVLHFLNEDVMEDPEAVARAIQQKIEELRG